MLIGKKEYTAVALNLEYKVFVVYVVALSVDSNNKVYPSQKA